MAYKTKPIWLLKDGHPNIIVKGMVQITNDNRFIEMIGQLKDIDSYIQTSGELVPGTSEYRVVLDCNGAKVYIPYYETKQYNCSHIERTLVNPRREVYQLITGDFYNYGSVLERLFATLDRGGTEADLLREIQCAEEMITQMEGGTFESEVFKQKLNQIWPNFGFYVCECLNCTDIIAETSYDMNELRDIVERCQKLNVEVSKEIKNILYCEESAQRNTKVYSLARKAHSMLYDKR